MVATELGDATACAGGVSEATVDAVDAWAADTEAESDDATETAGANVDVIGMTVGGVEVAADVDETALDDDASDTEAVTAIAAASAAVEAADGPAVAVEAAEEAIVEEDGNVDGLVDRVGAAGGDVDNVVDEEVGEAADTDETTATSAEVETETVTGGTVEGSAILEKSNDLARAAATDGETKEVKALLRPGEL